LFENIGHLTMEPMPNPPASQATSTWVKETAPASLTDGLRF